MSTGLGSEAAAEDGAFGERATSAAHEGSVLTVNLGLGPGLRRLEASALTWGGCRLVIAPAGAFWTVVWIDGRWGGSGLYGGHGEDAISGDELVLAGMAGR